MNTAMGLRATLTRTPHVVLATLLFATCGGCNKEPAPRPPSREQLEEERLKKNAETTAQSQKNAVRDFPELGVAGSPFNTLFRARVKELKAQSSHYFNNPEWPHKLAEEIHAARSSKMEGTLDSIKLAKQPALYAGRWIKVAGVLTDAKGTTPEGVLKLELEGPLKCELIGASVIRDCGLDPSTDGWDLRLESKGSSVTLKQRRKAYVSATRISSDVWEELLTFGPGSRVVLTGQLMIINGVPVLKTASLSDGSLSALRPRFR